MGYSITGGSLHSLKHQNLQSKQSYFIILFYQAQKMPLSFISFEIDNNMKSLSEQENLPLSSYFKNRKDKIPGKAVRRMVH